MDWIPTINHLNKKSFVKAVGNITVLPGLQSTFEMGKFFYKLGKIYES